MRKKRNYYGLYDHRQRHPTFVYFIVVVILGGLLVFSGYYFLGPESFLGRLIRNAIDAVGDTLG